MVGIALSKVGVFFAKRYQGIRMLSTKCWDDTALGHHLLEGLSLLDRSIVLSFVLDLVIVEVKSSCEQDTIG